MSLVKMISECQKCCAFSCIVS